MYAYNVCDTHPNTPFHTHARARTHTNTETQLGEKDEKKKVNKEKRQKTFKQGIENALFYSYHIYLQFKTQQTAKRGILGQKRSVCLEKGDERLIIETGIPGRFGMPFMLKMKLFLTYR